MEFSREQWVSVAILACVNVFAAAGNSLQAPFFPAEAKRKGASATEYGLVFGAYELTAFLVGPLAGKMVERFELRFLMLSGMILGSIALVLFGLVDRIENLALFIIISIILRIIESSGTALAAVAGFSLMAAMFPTDIATLFATLEVFYGLGFLLGPSIGGVLYTIGGFSFPFFFTGAIGITIALSIAILFRQVSVKQLHEEEDSHGTITVCKNPIIALNLLYVVMFAISIGFYSALLEPHLEQFNLSTLQTSMFFLINGMTYALASPIFGTLVDKGLEPRTVLMYSCVGTILSFTIMGPAPFIPFDATISSVIIALILQGCAFGASNVATFTEAFRAARNAGFPDSLGTFGMISGMWTGSLALGSFLGPLIGGILYDHVGFRWATQFIVGSFLILLAVIIIFTIYTNKRKRNEEIAEGHEASEVTPLLEFLSSETGNYGLASIEEGEA